MMTKRTFLLGTSLSETDFEGRNPYLPVLESGQTIFFTCPENTIGFLKIPGDDFPSDLAKFELSFSPFLALRTVP